jgi:Na+:H+ antiporter, NhaC family
MTGVLGVSTMSYLPWAFFNLLNPLVALAFAFTGFRIEHVEGEAGDTSPEQPLVAPGGDRHVE